MSANQEPIIIVSHTFWPDSNPRAIRLKELCCDLLRKNKKVFSLSAYGLIEHKDESYFETGVIKSPEVTKAQSVNLVKKFAKLFVWPDYSFRWIVPSLVSLNKFLNFYPNAVIFSSSFPVSSHICVLVMKNLGKAKGSWKIEISDPFSISPKHNLNNHKLWGWLNRAYERTVVKSCDAISVTTETTRLAYENFFPEAKNKVTVIPPVFPTFSDVEPLALPEKVSNSTAFVFSGTLYRDIRSPELAVEFVQYLTKNQFSCQMYFIGNTKTCFDQIPASQTFCQLGTVPHKQMLSYMKAAPVLVNIGNKGDLQLPSKLIEYISLKKYIFNFVSGEQDLSVSFLSQYPAHSNIYSSTDFQKAFEHYTNFVKEDPNLESNVDHYKKLYSINNLTQFVLR